MNPFNHGLSVEPEALTSLAETNLVARITDTLKTQRGTRLDVRDCVLRFGYGYEPPHAKLAPAPEWLYVRPELKAYESVTINLYPPSVNGQGIPLHVDSLDFGDTIRVLNLLTDVTVLFESPEKSYSPVKSIARVKIDRRTLYTMSKDVRTTWRHGTEGAPVSRISIVYRTLRAARAAANTPT